MTTTAFYAHKLSYIFSLFYYIISYLSNFYNHKMYIQVWGILPFMKKGLGTGPAPFRFFLYSSFANYYFSPLLLCLSSAKNVATSIPWEFLPNPISIPVLTASSGIT